MPNVSRYARFVAWPLLAAVLAVSLCAARCVAASAPASMPCHGEAAPQDGGPCAAVASQNWAVTPDVTATILALAVFLAVAFFLFPRVGALAPLRVPVRPLPAAALPPPVSRRRRAFSGRAPPRR